MVNITNSADDSGSFLDRDRNSALDPSETLEGAPTEQPNDPLTTTLAAAVGGSFAGAAIGQIVGGRTGATIGAVVGGIAGATIQDDKKVTHAIEQVTDTKVVDSFVDASEGGKAITSDRHDFAEAITEELSPAAVGVNYGYLARTHYQLGVSFGRQGNLSEAIEEFETALDYAPASAETHYNLGVALHRQGKLEPAFTHFDAAVRLCRKQGKEQGALIAEKALGSIQVG